MIEAETIIVGGGPAGSTCAWALNRLDQECILIDKERFPRTKLCGGWITPEVVQDLEINLSEYPHRFLSFHRLHWHLPGLVFKLQSAQHSIRRYEFDDWLLRRSGVPVFTHEVKRIRQEKGFYLIDDRFRCKNLVGAGGTRCPVYRTLFREANPHAKYLQTTTLEQEFPYDHHDSDCHLWFFKNGLPGYAWYVPKAKGYVNVGIGAMAIQLKRRGEDIHHYWQHFIRELEQLGLVQDHQFEPKGYSYFLRDNATVGQLENAFIIGDAAGLSTRDLAEGIGPAVRSGILAAEAIAQGRPYSLQSIPKYSIRSRLLNWPFEYMFIKRSRMAAKGGT